MNRKPKSPIPFRRILAQIMKDRKMTVRAAADMAGVSPSVIQSWLEGAVPQDLHAVDSLARNLGLSFRELLLGSSLDESSSVVTTAQFFDEREVFDGFCKITIKQLTPRRRKI